MAPTCTILKYLSRPNPRLQNRFSSSGTLTANDKWIPIEGVRPWVDFAYDILCARYESSLRMTITRFDHCCLIANAHLDEVAGEDTIEALATVNNFMPVSNALHATSKGYYGKGSKFFRQQSDGSPDWGLGDGASKNDGLTTFRNFCSGNIKSSSKWNSDDLWELVVIRITTSEDDVEDQPPRSSRGVQHRRLLSDTSNLSTALSAMSIDHSAYSGQSGSSSGMNPAPLEIARIPWAAGSGKNNEMTINLGLFFVAQLAFEERSISSSYPPLS
ncbi:uncharacterized protein RSE6_05142 [Rhynchosporium secalis]|uniref:Uncharacterized protein n=1 Tax=Rhynchosporium secalis TaxID=38038 RepID=A0A1E1M713_RHYSE|nr:uncharacterized protein RSE6_05142 [Rhynchosporium secalis]